MQEKFVEQSGCRLRYLQQGEEPVWLIHTGTHGDEQAVIDSVGRYLRSRAGVLPDLIWVPETSPSAVARGTRLNARDVNLNRVFYDDAEEPEVRANLRLLAGRSFRHFLSAHEDLTTDKFYLYEQDDNSATPEFARLYAGLAALGIGLYEGLDDDDPVLGNDIKRGYFFSRTSRRPNGVLDGTVEGYVGFNRLASGKIITAEVPGRLPQEKKDAVVALLFEYLAGSDGVRE
ncbi:MAG: hypothetical protein WCT10_00290 [Patescibacteria group bacterium]|jgi:hypothetical protein